MDSEFNPVGSSFLHWMYLALGVKFSILLPLAGIVACAMTAFLVVRGRGPFAATATVLMVTLPLWVGLYGALESLITSYRIIGAAADGPKLNETADAFFWSLAAPLVGVLMMIPAFLAAVIGSTVRALAMNPDKVLWKWEPAKPAKSPAPSGFDDGPHALDIQLRRPIGSSRDD